MTEQELRSLFFAKTGLVATLATIDYQLFLWGFKEGRRVERKECATAGGPEDSYQDEWFKAKADSAARILAMLEPE